jgi:asparagine synthase (glutamine-hydrolysing)
VRQAVRKQLVADVPVGAFLSGGIDSTLLVAHAVALGADVPAHTTGSAVDDAHAAADPMGDDAAFAADVARRFGIAHHAHTLRPDLVQLLPRLVWHADDPVADPTMINTFLICQAARADSKVLLSGMGADEVAGGYRRHVAASALRPFYALPPSLRAAVAGGARALAPRLRLPGLPGLPLVRRAVKALDALPAHPSQLAVGAFAQWTPDVWLARLGLPSLRSPSLALEVEARVDAELDDPLGATMAFDLGLYLPSHNLHYVDKMSMAASVEVRVPYMDNELVDFLTRLPYPLRVARTTAKATLRRAARGVIPDAVIDRPKTGFAAPIRGWLKGPLRSLLHEQLAPATVRRRGLFDAAGVSAMVEAHDRGVEDLAYPLWALLTLELWCQAHVDRAATALAAVNG